MEGNLHFKLDRASLVVGSKFTIFSLFYVVFEGNFPSTSPQGAYIWRDDLTEGFLRYRFGGLIFGGGYTWRGLFSEFYGIQNTFKHAIIESIKCKFPKFTWGPTRIKSKINKRWIARVVYTAVFGLICKQKPFNHFR